MIAEDSSNIRERPSACGDALGLSKRQWQILSYLCQGFHNKTIAYHLGIEIVTVKMHIGQLFKKLRVTNRTAAAVRGVQLYGHHAELEQALALHAPRLSAHDRGDHGLPPSVVRAGSTPASIEPLAVLPPRGAASMRAAR